MACPDWANQCLVDNNDMGRSCKDTLDQICAGAQTDMMCLDSACAVITDDDVPHASSWCNKCTGQACYGWRQLCELDPTQKQCTDALDLICKHKNPACHNDVCNYQGADERVKAVLDRWCETADERCQFPRPKPQGAIANAEQVIEDNSSTEAIVTLVVTNLLALGAAKKNKLRLKNEQIRHRETNRHANETMDRANALQQESDRQAGIIELISPTQLAQAETAYEAIQQDRARRRIELNYEILYNPDSPFGNRQMAREQLAEDIEGGILTPAEFESISQAAQSKFPSWQGAADMSPVAAGSPANPLSVPLLAGSGGGGHDDIRDSIVDPTDNTAGGLDEDRDDEVE